MRGALIIGLVLSLGSSYASADVKRAAVSKKTVKKASGQRFNLIAANETETTPQIIDGDISSPIDTVTREAEPSPWGLLVDSWNENSIGEVNRLSAVEGQESETAGWLLVRPSYRVNDTTSIAVGMEASHSWGYVDADDGTGDKEVEFDIQDPYFMAASSDLGTMGPFKTKGYTRLYLPFSEGSQDRNQITYLRGNAAAALPLGGGLKIHGEIEPRWYVQSEDSFQAEDGEPIENNKWGRIKYVLEVSGSLGGGFSFYSEHGSRYDYYFRNPDASENTEDTHSYTNETIVYYDFTKNLTFGVGASENRPQNEDYALYDENFSSYVVEGVLSF